MLHIVRHYKPDVVYLFITKSLWEGNERFEGHKNFDWENIIKFVHPEIQVKVEVFDIMDEHDFDSYKDIFHEKIEELKHQYNTDEILLNVTSGTPQMETTLCLEYITYPENKKCIQVASPARSSNANFDYSKYEDVEIDIEIVNEEETKHESRCKEIEIISFREAMLKGQLRSLIENYDYEAAYQLLVPNTSFKNRKQLMDKLRKYNTSIKNHQVIEEIDNKKLKYYSQKVLFHYWLLRIKEERNDLAEQLIRIKSVAEYILMSYFKRKYRDLLIEKGFNIKLNLNYKPEIIEQYKNVLASNGMLFQPNANIGLVSYKYLLEVLESESSIYNYTNDILKINELRNNVAHNLEELKIDKAVMDNIKNAMNALKELILIVFDDINEKDLTLIYDVNDKLEELL
ncbi:type III-A CRISPR-associated CARF protein Csm6 [Macrococcus capreoli]